VNPALIGFIVFACTLAGAFAGTWLHKRLPEHHFNSESKDSVKLCVGLIATMTALVLGLVTADAKNHFDSVNAAVNHTAVDVLTLDRLLARYGPETREIRATLQRAVALRIDLIWPQGRSRQAELDPSKTSHDIEAVPDRIRALKPHDEVQESLKGRAAELSESLLQTRWLSASEVEPSVQMTFVVILLFWLSITFTIFGLLAPGNATVRTVFFVCAVSVGSAMFLVLELDGPFHGLIRVSAAPMRFALAHLNQ